VHYKSVRHIIRPYERMASIALYRGMCGSTWERVSGAPLVPIFLRFL